MKPNRYPYSGKKEPSMVRANLKIVDKLTQHDSYIHQLMSENKRLRSNLDAGTIIFQ